MAGGSKGTAFLDDSCLQIPMAIMKGAFVCLQGVCCVYASSPCVRTTFIRLSVGCGLSLHFVKHHRQLSIIHQWSCTRNEELPDVDVCQPGHEGIPLLYSTKIYIQHIAHLLS